MFTKEELILELLLSLNKGNSGYITDRVSHVIFQYEKLVEAGIIKEKIEGDVTYTNIPKK